MDRCLVFDLDETLVCACEDVERLKETRIFLDPSLIDLRSRVFHFDLENVAFNTNGRNRMWAVIRPGAQEILNFCKANKCTVAVWSAGEENYVNQIVKRLFRDVPKPVHVWSHDDCRFKTRKEYDKPLEKLFSVDNRFRYDNTLLIDDRIENFELANPDNGILIPKYEPEFTVKGIREDDSSLYQIIDWLRQNPSGDVRTIEKVF